MNKPSSPRRARPRRCNAGPQKVVYLAASGSRCPLTATHSLLRVRAFTILELLVILGVLALFAGMLLAQLDQAPQDVRRITCVNHLKQVGLGYRVFAVDHQDLFPMSLSTNRGGTKELIPGSPAYVHFQVLSNEFSSPKVLVCPADGREAAPDFRSLRNTNLSYFIGLDADETQPQMLLAGDRNVTNGVTPSGGVLGLTPDRLAGWTGDLHGGYGNVALADGSVQQVSSARLREQLRHSGNRANRIQLPE
jgi:prepilin-type processing-associated H-X9-DG protein